MRKNRLRRTGKRHNDDNSAFFAERESRSANQQAQGAFFQPKLEIDPVNSPSEKEADAAADQVVNHTQSQDRAAHGIQRKDIQRKGKEEEKPKAKLIQRKGKEEEKPKAKLIQRKGKEEEKPKAKLIQRKGKEEEKPKAKRIQRKGKGEEKEAGGGSRVLLEDQINKTKGGGMPLPEDLRAEMEKEFGADFSQVRIHTGADAIEMTQAIHAHAFTHGYDVYFNEGRFDPASKSGKELLAHELAHVVQQKGT